MAEPGRINYTFSRADNAAEVTGEVIETIAVGTYLDVMVDHSTDAEFWCAETTFQTEKGVNIALLYAHHQAGRFAFRISNDGTNENAHFDPYHVAPYGTASEVRVTFARKGFLSP